MTKLQRERLVYLRTKARSAALHLGIFQHHINVSQNKKYEIHMIIPGEKDAQRIYSNMTYIECITFLDALKIAAKVVKQVNKRNTDFINRHFEAVKG